MVEVEHNRAIIWKISEPKSFEFFCWVMEPFRMITPISFRSGGQERNQVWLKMSEIEPALALLWSKISTNIHHLLIWSKRSFRWLELWVTFQLGFAEMITDFMCYDVLWCFHKLTVTSARLTNSSGLISTLADFKTPQSQGWLEVQEKYSINANDSIVNLKQVWRKNFQSGVLFLTFRRNSNAQKDSNPCSVSHCSQKNPIKSISQFILVREWFTRQDS